MDSGDPVECDACALPLQAAGACAVAATCARAQFEVASPYAIQTKLQLIGSNELAGSTGASSPPLVTDLDGDGVKEIIVGDCAVAPGPSDCAVTVFDQDGVELLSLPATHGALFGAVDLDGVAGAELLIETAPDGNPQHDSLVAYRSDGRGLWAVDLGVAKGVPTVADLEGAGWPTVIARGLLLDGRTGVVTGSFDPVRGDGQNAAVADVDHDGTLEFAESGALFAADGSTLWELPWPLGMGGLSIALQADADPEPEFLFVVEGFVLVDTDGTILTQVDQPAAMCNSTVLADVDGDGAPEVVLDVGGVLTVYHLDGSLLWQRGDQGWVSHIAGWDLDGDGATEIIAQCSEPEDAEVLEILDGRTGDRLYSTPNASSGEGPPVVADIDGDAHAELLVGGGAPHSDGWIPSVTVYHQVNDTWPPAGPAWPVPDYHITNVGSAGEIPQGEPDPAPWTYNVYHARAAADEAVANLTPVLIDVCSDTCEEGGSVQIEVAVANSGPAEADAVVVRVLAGGVTVTETVLPQVRSGVVSEGIVLTVPGVSFDRGEVRVVVDPGGGVLECEERDNAVVVGDPR